MSAVVHLIVFVFIYSTLVWYVPSKINRFATMGFELICFYGAASFLVAGFTANLVSAVVLGE